MVDAARVRFLVTNTIVSCLSSNQSSMRRNRMAVSLFASLARMTTSFRRMGSAGCGRSPTIT